MIFERDEETVRRCRGTALVLLSGWDQPDSPLAHLYNDDNDNRWQVVMYLAKVDHEWLVAQVRNPEYSIQSRRKVAYWMNDPAVWQGLEAEAPSDP